MREKGMNRYSIIGWIIVLLVIATGALLFFTTTQEIKLLDENDTQIKTAWFRSITITTIIFVVFLLALLVAERIRARVRARSIKKTFLPTTKQK